MKTSTMSLMMVAAALAVTAGSASAQTYRAEIPMSFRVADKSMTPGSYEIVVNQSGGRALISLHGLDSSALVVPIPGADAPRTWRQAGKPKVTFDCLGSACTLSRLWNGRDSFTYGFPARALPTVEAHRTIVVTLALVKAH